MRLYDAVATEGFDAAVSLHCHTRHSKENLAFIPHYASRVPVVAGLFRSWAARFERQYGRPLDLSEGYWTPPLSAREVFEFEAEQIEKKVGLRALVSITDHDDIEGAAHLQVLQPSREVPVSLEWTVPFGEGFFHVGVHNLPARRAGEMTAELLAYTSRPAERRLEELLAALDESGETLVVLNHPLWDIEYAGARRHAELLKAFLDKHGPRVHALEVNGYRSWRENREVLRMAEATGHAVVSGGDRHGCEPNAVLNLTNARTLAEFACEVREGRSEILLMPAYREPLAARQLRTFADVMGHYPEHRDGLPLWFNRVYFQTDDAGPRPLHFYWPKKGAPKWIKRVIWVMCVLGSRRFQPVLRLALFNNRIILPGDLAGELSAH